MIPYNLLIGFDSTAPECPDQSGAVPMAILRLMDEGSVCPDTAAKVRVFI